MDWQKGLANSAVLILEANPDQGFAQIYSQFCQITWELVREEGYSSVTLCWSRTLSAIYILIESATKSWPQLVKGRTAYLSLWVLFLDRCWNEGRPEPGWIILAPDKIVVQLKTSALEILVFASQFVPAQKLLGGKSPRHSSANFNCWIWFALLWSTYSLHALSKITLRGNAEYSGYITNSLF